MAGGRAQLIIEFLVDSGKAGADIDATASKFEKFEGTMGRLAGPATAVTGALVGLGTVAVNAASDAQQSMGAVESVFGSAASTIEGYASTAATAVGLSANEYRELAAVAGAAFQNMGLSADDAAAQTDQLIGIGADLAATFGGSTADAVAALQAAFRGEADPAEKFGLNLKQSAVNAKLAELGLDGLTGAAGEAARQQAIMALIMEGTADVQGQFARETDTLAGSQQIATAQWKDATAQLGTALLPAVTAVTTMLAGMAQWVSENSTVVLVLAGVIGTLAVGVLAINAALSVYRAVQTVATAATWASNAAWLASPITWIIVGIAAIAAGLVLLWRNSETFRNIVTGVWTAVKNGAVAAWNGIKGAINAVITWARTAVASAGARINAVWTGIKSVASGVWNAIRAVVTAVVAAVTARVTAVRTTATSAWNAIKSAGTSAFNTLRSIATGALNAILAPVRAIRAGFDSVVSAVRNVISWIGRIKLPDLGGIFNLFSGSSSAASSAGLMSAAAAPGFTASRFAAAAEPMATRTSLVQAMASLRGPSTGTGPALTVINVSGTLNDTDSARAVRRVLRRDSRRRGGVVIGAA